jgi:DNA-binding ferritin-like protein
MTITELGYVAYLWRNDLHFLHHHITGVNFDEYHDVAGELYDKALEDFDYFMERGIEKGEAYVNLSHVHETDIYEDWNVIHNNESNISSEEFIEYLDENGQDYIDALEIVRDSIEDTNIQSTIDDKLDFWKNEILYKNKARMEK